MSEKKMKLLRKKHFISHRSDSPRARRTIKAQDGSIRCFDDARRLYNYEKRTKSCLV